MPTLKIDILAVGKLKERFWSDACAEYLKRLQPYATVRVIEVDDVDCGRAGSVTRVLEVEAAALTKRIQPGSYLVVLDASGTSCTSEQIATLVESKLSDASHHVSFVIGGSHGLAEHIKSAAGESLSLGAITLPHNLARVVLLEQLYRAFKIIHHEPYHK